MIGRAYFRAYSFLSRGALGLAQRSPTLSKQAPLRNFLGSDKSCSRPVSDGAFARYWQKGLEHLRNTFRPGRPRFSHQRWFRRHERARRFSPLSQERLVCPDFSGIDALTALIDA